MERKMEVLGMGAARSLLRKPNRLSQTMEPPLKAELKRSIMQSMPLAR